MTFEAWLDANWAYFYFAIIAFLWGMGVGSSLMRWQILKNCDLSFKQYQQIALQKDIDKMEARLKRMRGEQ